MLELLPTELVDQIAGLLDDPINLCTLRLTCHTIYQKATHAFARAWFTKVQVHLCPKSLQRLDEILRHDTARLAVRELHAGASARMHCGELLCRHCDTAIPHWQAVFPTGCLDTLHAAAGALANCDRFTLELPYGPEPSTLISAVAFGLSLISQTGSRPRHLSLRMNKLVPKTPHGCHVTPALLGDPNFRGTWGTLRYLRIKWRLADAGPDEVPSLARLITLAPKLESIDLDFDEDCDHTAFEGSGPFLETLLVTDNWQPGIKNLQLAGIGLVGHIPLIKFLRHFRQTLTSVSLGFFGLLDSRWSAIYPILGSDEFPNLGTFTQFTCYEKTENTPLWPGDPFAQAAVLFCPLRNDVKVPGYEVVKICSDEIFVEGLLHSIISAVRFVGHGPGMKLALERIAGAAYQYGQIGSPPKYARIFNTPRHDFEPPW